MIGSLRFRGPLGKRAIPGRCRSHSIASSAIARSRAGISSPSWTGNDQGDVKRSLPGIMEAFKPRFDPKEPSALGHIEVHLSPF